MSFAVQDDAGSVAGATSYLSVEAFEAYISDRYTLDQFSLDPYDASDKQKALVRATDYLDQRFSFRGRKLNGNQQPTEWPRFDVQDNAQENVYGVPNAIKEATAEYAVRALVSTTLLSPDPTRDATGAAIQSISKALSGVGSKTITYANAGTSTLPEYPAADMKIFRAGLVRSTMSGEVRRG